VGTGEETTLSGIMRLVAEAQQSKSRAQHLADRAAQMLTGVAISVRAHHAGGLAAASARPSTSRSCATVTVLVIACPHALGLAVPLVVAISTTKGAQERPAGARPARARGGEEPGCRSIFDKTGTLTLGEFRVVDLVAWPTGSPTTTRSASPPPSRPIPSTPSPAAS
jgi:P-type Cu2+ transporter